MSATNVFMGKEVEIERSTRFNNLSEEQLMSYFKQSNWDAINTNKERIELLQEVENRQADSQGRTPALVKEHYGSFDGSYSPSTRVIEVNIRKTPENSSYNILDSVVHEGRHDYQNCAMQNRINKEVDIENTQLLNMYDELNYNYSNFSNKGLYDCMACEMDSNVHACNYLLDKEKYFKNDPEYGKYLNARSQHFKKVDNLYENKKDVLCEERRKMLNKPYHLKFIDKETKDKLVEEYKNRTMKDSIKNKCEETKTRINSVQHKLKNDKEQIIEKNQQRTKEIEAYEKMQEYFQRNGYTSRDYVAYSVDPEWKQLNQEMRGNYENKSAMEQMADYHRAHNTSASDFQTYSQDPEWISINEKLVNEINNEKNQSMYKDYPFETWRKDFSEKVNIAKSSGDTYNNAQIEKDLNERCKYELTQENNSENLSELRKTRIEYYGHTPQTSKEDETIKKIDESLAKTEELERLEKERLEQERLEQERLEEERREQERNNDLSYGSRSR